MRAQLRPHFHTTLHTTPSPTCLDRNCGSCGAEMVGVANKLLAVVVAAVFDLKSKPFCCVDARVAGVLLNRKLRPVVIAGVEEVPKDSVDCGAFDPNGVLVRLKPVEGYCPNPKPVVVEVVGVPKVNVVMFSACN